jgi:NAD(P)H dehydrogenase (quinone)
MNRRDLLKGSAPVGASLLATAAPVLAQQGSPPTVLVAYHSVTGNTEKMAQGVAEGARTAGATVNLKRVGNVTADDLVTADAITVGSPVYFARAR